MASFWLWWTTKRRREESEDFQREIDIEELNPIRIIMREKVGQKSNNNSKAQNSKSLFDQQIVIGLEDRWKKWGLSQGCLIYCVIIRSVIRVTRAVHSKYTWLGGLNGRPEWEAWKLIQVSDSGKSYDATMEYEGWRFCRDGKNESIHHHWSLLHGLLSRIAGLRSFHERWSRLGYDGVYGMSVNITMGHQLTGGRPLCRRVCILESRI